MGRDWGQGKKKVKSNDLRRSFEQEKDKARSARDDGGGGLTLVRQGEPRFISAPTVCCPNGEFRDGAEGEGGAGHVFFRSIFLFAWV